MPEGLDNRYSMTFYGHDFLLIMFGKWPIIQSDFFDSIQINECFEPEQSFNLLCELLPFQRATHLVVMPNPRWMDRDFYSLKQFEFQPVKVLGKLEMFRNKLLNLREHSFVPFATVTMLTFPDHFGTKVHQFNIFNDHALRTRTFFDLNYRYRAIAGDNSSAERWSLDLHVAATLFEQVMDAIIQKNEDYKISTKSPLQSFHNRLTAYI